MRGKKRKDEDEPPTESKIKAEEKIEKEILRLKKLSKARDSEVKEEMKEDKDGTQEPTVPQPQPQPLLQPQPQQQPQPQLQPLTDKE